MADFLIQNLAQNVTVSKRLEELEREVARAHGQPAGKEEDGGFSDESGPLLVL